MSEGCQTWISSKTEYFASPTIRWPLGAPSCRMTSPKCRSACIGTERTMARVGQMRCAHTTSARPFGSRRIGVIPKSSRTSPVVLVSLMP